MSGSAWLAVTQSLYSDKDATVSSFEVEGTMITSARFDIRINRHPRSGKYTVANGDRPNMTLDSTDAIEDANELFELL
jgi:hypothetical protein